MIALIMRYKSMILKEIKNVSQSLRVEDLGHIQFSKTTFKTSSRFRLYRRQFGSIY